MSAVASDACASIRPMREADLNQVMDIELSAYEFPWTRGIFADCLRVGYSCWVYEAYGDVQAYAVLSYGAGEAHLLNICVSPDWQGMGLGRKLLIHMLRQAERLAATQIYLEVRPSNPVALGLYRELGFKQVGRRRGYYPARKGREDAIVMSRPVTVDDRA